MAIYEVEMQMDGAWHFHHQHTSKAAAEHDAAEYGRLLKVPFRARLRTAAEEAALQAKDRA